MTNDRIDLAVIGGGSAGLSAAAAAGSLGIRTELIDNALHPGGQYFKHNPKSRLVLQGSEHGLEDYLQRIANAGVTIHTNMTVWHIQVLPGGSDFELFLNDPENKRTSLKARKVILAAGAIERVLPFEGWTLPGVMTTGAAQQFSGAPNVQAGRRALVYGTGPLLWPAVQHLVNAGIKVSAVLEANRFPWRGWKLMAFALQQRSRLQEGMEYLRTFRQEHIPIHWGAKLKAAVGNGGLEKVEFYAYRSSQVKTLKADYLFTAFGLSPSTQILQLLDASMVQGSSLRYQAPLRDTTLQTSLPGLYAVGDGVFTMGKEAAALEGMLAGMQAAAALGVCVGEHQLESIQKELLAQQRFTRLMMTAFPYPVQALLKADDNTILCRCEQITFGDIRKLIHAGVTYPGNIKALSRIGMGRCQGRYCGCNLNDLLCQTGAHVNGDHESLTVRPPVLPVPIEALLQEEVPDAS